MATLHEFEKGDLDIIIASRPIIMGIDGLQHICNNLIVMIAPWTSVEMKQLEDRLYRQGQIHDIVKITMPICYMNLPNGKKWSLDRQRYIRINYKKTICDLVTDGIIPQEHLMTEDQFLKSSMALLKRLAEGKHSEIKRRKIIVPLSQGSLKRYEKKLELGEFAKINQEMKRSPSNETYQKMKENPAIWEI